MRLYPPVFVLSRKTSKDICAGKYVFPAGTNVCTDFFQVHYSPDIWENPMEYDPLRFQSRKMETHGPYDYIPFSAGSSYKLYWAEFSHENEIKICLEQLLNCFQLELDDKHTV